MCITVYKYEYTYKWRNKNIVKTGNIEIFGQEKFLEKETLFSYVQSTNEHW